MTIQTSSTREVDALLQQLRSPVKLERDAAVARLRILGGRARDRVLAIVTDKQATPDARITALGVIDAFGDAKARAVAIGAAADGQAAVAIAGIQALRAWLTTDDDAAALETISGIVTDDTRQMGVRQAALDALSDLPESLTRPLIDKVSAALADRPPLDAPDSALEWLRSHTDAPFGALHDLLIHARDRQGDVAMQEEQHRWQVVRAAVHAALARRGSRIALYDAREMFERAQSPLPVDMLTAMETNGDLSCLESLARAWDGSRDQWWRGRVSLAAAAIIKRERATARNATVKHVRTRWEGFLG